MRLAASITFATSLLTLSPNLAAAETCAPARAMIVLDKSSSMVTGSIGTQTKWQVAVAGIGQVLGAYESKAEFGLMTFPQPNQCGPGGLDVTPAMANKSEILAALSTPPPNAGNWTPMAQTLSVAAVEPSLVNAQGTKHVILVTDGWQWCSPYDPNTRYDGTDAIGKLQAAGITTWIVGFGAEVDAAALNQMAVVAGTQQPNCNPGSTDPAATNNCYFQVDNSAQLVAALTQITGAIVADEICDGIDNDCDGEVDEDLTRDCSNGCGAGRETCSAGSWGSCTAPAPAAETCDGDDNDCDGQVDEEDAPLCGGSDVCTAGECQDTGATGEMQAGCGCETNGAPSGAALVLAFGVLVLTTRRRRK